MSEIEQYIGNHLGLSKEDASSLSKSFKLENLAKNDYYLKEDKVCRKLSFIKSGSLRIFNFTEQGKEITQWISTHGEFITELSSLMFNQASRWNIQALVDCELYTISQEDYLNIGNTIPAWKDLEKLFMAKCFITLENRVYTFLSMSAEERFMHLFEYKKELFNEIPLQYLASMLGMSPETLSRIRNKMIS
jgi:CRP-like cAMP-binding protein